MRATLDSRFSPLYVLADDSHVGSANATYKTLFHSHILRGLVSLQGLITQANGELPLTEREQAWLLLDYGLKVSTAWPLVRSLLITLADQMERAGFRDEWRSFLERGISAAQQAEDTLTQARLWLHLGRIYRLLSDFGKAQHAFEECVTYAHLAQERRVQAMAHNQLAYLARLQSRYAEAEAQIALALELLDENDPECATSYSWQGAISYDQMAWEQAVQH
jgi:tetratricopeptide (TPR) repeat protein